VFDNNKIGVQGSDSLINCKFTNHSEFAVEPYGYTAFCEITNNKLGMKGYFNSENNTFINNEVSNNETGILMYTFFNGYIKFTDNKICNNTTDNLVLVYHLPANLANNCWCSTDSLTISSKIYDGYDDISRGLVNFMPFKTDCNTILTIPQEPAISMPALTIYPNPVPAGGDINLEVNSDIRNIHVQDMQGKVVVSHFNKNANNRYSLTLENHLTGIFFVRCQLLNGDHIVRKITVH
jgi:hypothetical protein